MKKLISLALAGTMLLGLSACNSSDNSSSAAQSGSGTAETGNTGEAAGEEGLKIAFLSLIHI